MTDATLAEILAKDKYECQSHGMKWEPNCGCYDSGDTIYWDAEAHACVRDSFFNMFLRTLGDLARPPGDTNDGGGTGPQAGTIITRPIQGSQANVQ